MKSEKNIVLIVMDTARADIVHDGINGKEVAPNLKEIANSGSSFTNAFSVAPWTLPSHASLFTGQYPSSHGAHAGSKYLNEGTQTIAGSFAKAGYETVAASNNAWISESFGFGQGFDKFYKNWQFVQSDTDFGEAGLTNEGTDLISAIAKEMFDGNIIKNLLNAAYAKFRFSNYDDSGAKRTTEWVADWLSSRGNDDPFFLFVNYLEPHIEYSPPREFVEKFLPTETSIQKAKSIPQDPWRYITGQLDLTEHDFEILKALYAAEVSYLDSQIGNLIDELRRDGCWDNTLFLVMGDHGENIGDHNLMDHQYCLYDSLLNVPLIAHGGNFSNGGVIEQPVELIDIPVTLLEETGVKDKQFTSEAQGKSIFQHKKNQVFSEYMAPQPSRDAINQRVGDPDNVMDQYDRSLRSVRTKKYKLIQGSDDSIELYNIEECSDESTEISEDHPKIVERLQQKLSAKLGAFEPTDSDQSMDMDEQTKKTLEDLGYLQ